MTENRSHVILNRKQGNNFKREIKLDDLKNDWLGGLPIEFTKILEKTNWLSTITVTDNIVKFDIIKIEKKIDEFMDTIFPFKFNYDNMLSVSNGTGDDDINAAIDFKKYEDMLKTRYDTKTNFSEKMLTEKDVKDEDLKKLTDLKYTMEKSDEIINTSNITPEYKKKIEAAQAAASDSNTKDNNKPPTFLGIGGGLQGGSTNTRGVDKLCERIKEEEDDETMMIEKGEFIENGQFIWFGELKFKSVDQEHIEELKRVLLNDISPPPPQITFKQIMKNCKELRERTEKKANYSNKLLEMLYDDDDTASKIFCMLIYLDSQLPKIPNKYGTLIDLKDPTNTSSTPPNHIQLMEWNTIIEGNQMYQYGGEIKYLELLTQISNNGIKFTSEDLKVEIEKLKMVDMQPPPKIPSQENEAKELEDYTNERTDYINADENFISLMENKSIGTNEIIDILNTIITDLKGTRDETLVSEKQSFIDKQNQLPNSILNQRTEQDQSIYLNPGKDTLQSRIEEMKRMMRGGSNVTGNINLHDLSNSLISIIVNDVISKITLIHKNKELQDILDTYSEETWIRKNEFKPMFKDTVNNYLTKSIKKLDDIDKLQVDLKIKEKLIEFIDLFSDYIIKKEYPDVTYIVLSMGIDYYSEIIDLIDILDSDNSESSQSQSNIMAGGGVDIWKLIEVTGIKNEIQSAIKTYKEYVNDKQPIKDAIVKKLKTDIEEDAPLSIISKVANIMVGIVNESDNYKIVNNDEKWYYNWADRTATSDIMVIRKRYKWCYKLESLYLKKHYEILFMFIQINKIYRKIYQMYYILLTLIDLDPSSKNIGAILIPYTHKPTITKGLLPIQEQMNQFMEENLNQKDIDDVRTNIGNISAWQSKDAGSDAIKQPDQSSHLSGEQRGISRANINQDGTDDNYDLEDGVRENTRDKPGDPLSNRRQKEMEEWQKEITPQPSVPNEDADEENASEVGERKREDRKAEWLKKHKYMIPNATKRAEERRRLAEESSDNAKADSSLAKFFEKFFGGSMEGGSRDDILNKIKAKISELLMVKKKTNSNMNQHTKEKLISRLTRQLNLRLDTGLQKFISSDIKEPEEGIPYLGLSESGNRILKESKIEILNPKYYFDVVTKLEKDSNSMEMYLNNVKNENNISKFESESQLKKDILLNPENNIPEHLFNDLKRESNREGIKMKNPHLDLSDEDHVKDVQKYLNRCHYIELLYLKKHNEFMIIYKFFFHLYKKYLIITIILLRYISLLDYKDSGNRKIGVPEEMLKPIIINMDQVKELSGFSLLDDFTDQPSKKVKMETLEEEEEEI